MEEASGIKVMERQSDFQWEPRALSQYIESEGELCLFTPKFHPGLNFIERVWGRAKWFLRLFCDYSFPGLKSRLSFALGVIKILKEHRELHARLKKEEYVLTERLVQKYARRSRNYVAAYLQVRDREDTNEFMKKLKSHRSTSIMETY